MTALVQHYRRVLSEALAGDAGDELAEVQHQLLVTVPAPTPPGSEPPPVDRVVQEALKAQVSRSGGRGMCHVGCVLCNMDVSSYDTYMSSYQVEGMSVVLCFVAGRSVLVEYKRMLSCARG